ncbi:glycosyltransferase [Microbacterium sp. NPDC080220]|uniref:glycosyltransferase n=1 Tax=Microbacterium sp. NPDC080220 TaxID=3161017 RepID=UPI0034322502
MLQVVAHYSLDRRYGGPTTVAVAQSQALTERGIHVTFAAACDDSAGVEAEPSLRDVTTHLFPARYLLGRQKFAGLWAPSLVRWVRSNSGSYDAVHVHIARDLTTLPAARVVSSSTRLVLQPHGMLTARRGPIHKAIDQLSTRHVFEQANLAIALSEEERRDLEGLSSGTPVTVIPNAFVPNEGSGGDTVRDDRKVLFLARLNSRKRPIVFAEAARTLLERKPELRFEIAGPDEGEGVAIRHARGASRGAISVTGAVAAKDVPRRMRSAALYVLPSMNEPFGMTILEALASGTPVILDKSSVIGGELVQRGLARLFDGSAQDLAYVIEAALSDLSFRERAAHDGPTYVASRFGPGPMVERLLSAYRREGKSEMASEDGGTT